MANKCMICKEPVANRSKGTKYCRKCYLLALAKNKTGRTLPDCSVCGKELSTIRNKTGKCQKCSLIGCVPWNKGKKGGIPWNKGKSKFKNSEEYRIHKNILRNKRRKLENPQTRIADRLRTLIRNQTKTQTTRRLRTKATVLLGCSVTFFRDYLESIFHDGMTWDNYGNGEGKWNIDHVKPLSLFDLRIESEQRKAFHYKNCQPMWAIENIKKGNKYWPLPHLPTL